LAIADDRGRAARAEQWLMPAGDVDDREPAVPQHDTRRGVDALVVRTAMGDAGEHGADGSGIDRLTWIERGDARNAAHATRPRAPPVTAPSRSRASCSRCDARCARRAGPPA